MRKKMIGLVGAAGLAAGLAAAPAGIKLAVETTYPWVRIGSVTLGWPIRFHQVGISRPGLQAHLDVVLATPVPSDPIEILGGEVRMRRGNQKSPSVPSGREILASRLRVIVEDGEDTVTLVGVDLNTSHIRFDSGSGQIRGREIQLGAGQADRTLTNATLTNATLTVEIPFDLPGVPRQGVVEVRGIRANVTERSAQIEEVKFAGQRASGIQIRLTPTEMAGQLDLLVVDHPWVGVGPLEFRTVGFQADLPVIRFQLGGADVQVDLQTRSIQGAATCAGWVRALPLPLPPALTNTSTGWRGGLAFDVRTQPPTFHLTYDCSYDCSAEPIQALKSGTVRYRAYDQKGGTFERVIGRHRAGWTNVTDVPAHVTRAFITLEDPGFLLHRGMIVQALQNSLEINQQLGHFFRGGSTITQQLAKNLWLPRHKTLSRKAFEALLALALESCLSKEEILELYMNVVEFGPDLYGIGPAAQHYFRKEVGDLEPDEGFYLASLLPAPSRAIAPSSGGLEQARRLMKRLVGSGLLPEAYVPNTPVTSDWETID